ncbi:MAG: MptD family putative ECF transporter S component, partial [Oscillospiraceae bacterium]
MNTVSKNKLSTKDIIVTAVLGVICIAIRFVFMILGGIFPIAWFASHMLDAIFIGPIFMLIVAKTKRTGPVFVISLVSGLAMLSASVYVLISSIIAGILAELALRKGKFESKVWISISYILFSFGMIGDFYHLLFKKAAFLAYRAEFGMIAEYLAAVETMVSPVTK